MPTICRFYGIVIAMYYDHHGHPHFHARHADGQAKVRIDQVEVIESGTIVWPGVADLAPDTLYQRVRTGLWPGENAAA